MSDETPVEIRLNPDGTLDEVCAPGVHLEQMSASGWFLSVGEVNVWLNAKGKITATYDDNRALSTQPERRDDGRETVLGLRLHSDR